MRQLLLDLTQAPAPTFSNFVPGRSAEALLAARSAAAGAIKEPVLYLWGEPGSGKTHLLRAMCAEAEGAMFVRGAEYAGQETARVLVIDDVEQLQEPAQVALFNAFNEGRHQLIVASARAAPREVALRRDLATRLALGLTYLLHALTDDEKRDALAAHARVRGFALSDEVRAYLLTHTRRDMPSLIATLDALDRYSLETGRPVTVPLLREAIRPAQGSPTP